MQTHPWISEAIHDTEDLDSLYQEIHDILSAITNVTNFYIALADWKLNSISFPYFVDEKDKKPQPYKMKKGLTEYVLNTGDSLLLNHDIYKNLIKSNNIEPIGSPCYNWLGVPLKLLNGKTIGMIGVQNYNNDYIFREEDMKLLQFVSDQIAMAIDKVKSVKEMHYLAYYDKMTKLPNRTLFNDRAKFAFKNAQRNNDKYAVLFLDLDEFKIVNDTMGHNAGDKLLKIVAQRIIDCVREGDTISHWGGDEFTILSKIKNIKDNKKLCDRILSKVKEKIIINRKTITCSLSIGAAIYPLDGDNIDDLIQKADMAMYVSKTQGKDKFTIYNDEINQKMIEKLNLEVQMRKKIHQINKK